MAWAKKKGSWVVVAPIRAVVLAGPRVLRTKLPVVLAREKVCGPEFYDTADRLAHLESHGPPQY